MDGINCKEIVENSLYGARCERDSTYRTQPLNSRINGKNTENMTDNVAIFILRLDEKRQTMFCYCYVLCTTRHDRTTEAWRRQFFFSLFLRLSLSQRVEHSFLFHGDFNDYNNCYQRLYETTQGSSNK